MSYEITGNIVSKSDVKQVSDTFKVREFAIKVNDGSQYENFASFQAVQDKTALLDGLKAGDEIKVHFDLRGREHGGRYFTNLNAWRVEKVQAGQQPSPAHTEAPAAAMVAETGSDLPF